MPKGKICHLGEVPKKLLNIAIDANLLLYLSFQGHQQLQYFYQRTLTKAAKSDRETW